MNARSLKLRLLLLGAITISAALLAAGLGIVGLFERHVERRAEAELDTYSRQISAGISFDAKGEPTFNHPLADPRFETPLSGLYWQVSDNVGGRVLRSRSLWDTVLKLPRDVLDMGAVHRHTLEGPSGSSLLVRERDVTYTTPSGSRQLRIAVALDEREIHAARGICLGGASCTCLARHRAPRSCLDADCHRPHAADGGEEKRSCGPVR